MRWLIGNAIAESRPFGISDWVVKTARDSRFYTSKQMLLIALARMVPKEVANPILMAQFDEFPTHAALALAESGGRKELEFLEGQRDSLTGEWRKSADKAIKKLSKKLSR